PSRRQPPYFAIQLLAGSVLLIGVREKHPAGPFVIAAERVVDGNVSGRHGVLSLAELRNASLFISVKKLFQPTVDDPLHGIFSKFGGEAPHHLRIELRLSQRSLNGKDERSFTIRAEEARPAQELIRK